MEAKLLVCLFLVGVATAVPVSRNDNDNDRSLGQCARQCKDDPQKFDYQPGKTYIYDYETEADTLMAGASEEKARMVIKARALIDVTDRCEHTLRLKNIEVSHSEPGQTSLKTSQRQRKFRKALTAEPLRYSFDDGIIRDICHSSSEEIWVLNFKRGLLSALQNSWEDFEEEGSKTIREVDVSGDCQAEYSSEKGSSWWHTIINIKKTKNLMACLSRSNIKSIIPLVPYQTQSQVQSLPVMKSTHECEQKVKKNRIEKSICKESHLFAPFSNHQRGARTDIRQTLTYNSMRNTVNDIKVDTSKESNLLYQHVYGNEEIKNSLQYAKSKLKEICEQTHDDIRPETPRLFTELAQSVKQMDRSDLNKIYYLIKQKNICSQNEKGMKFFLDTLPVSGTTAAVSLMVEIINHDLISDVEKQVWLTSLSLIPDPKEDIVPPLSKLLEGPSSDQALLPVSIVLHTMCDKNVDCDNSNAYQGIMNQINKDIDSDCTGDDRAKVLRALRAIGNIGCGQDFVTTLTKCMKSRHSPLELKVVAADAFRRFPCKTRKELRPLFEAFESEDADAELRIASFRSLMRCPSDSVLTRIADQLNREQDSNVGTYVYSHLVNLMETSDPHKQETREAVSRLTLKPFEGGWKSSRNVEASALFNKFNLGYVADGDLIWSKSSVSPRSARVNLTVELFGNSINFFEAGARVEGLDQFLEKYFGNNGYFPNNDETKPEDLKAFVYARMFENEMFFKNIKGTEELKNLKSKLNLETFLETLSKEYDYTYSHSQQLMDESFIFPTTIGLPVNLTINSTVSVNAEAKGVIEISGFLSRVMPVDISTDLTASAGFELTGSMMVDAILYKQGLRMRNTLHSSINVNSNLRIRGREDIRFEITSPEKKQELFDARSQFFVIHDNVENEQEMIKDNRKEIQKCTGDKFGKITGLQLCGEIQYPNASMSEDAPYFPFTGPASASLVLEKVDTQNSYLLSTKWIRSDKKIDAQFQLNTPGSKIDRHIAVDMTIGTHKDPHVDIQLRSPWKKVVMNAHASKNPEFATLGASVVVDDAIYKLASTVDIKKVGYKRTYIPVVELDYEDKRMTLLTGSVTYEQRRELSASLDFKNILTTPLLLDGQVVNRRNQKRVEVAVGSNQRKEYIFRLSTTKSRGKTKSDALVQIPKQKLVEIKTTAERRPKKIKADISIDSIKIKEPITASLSLNQKDNKYPVKVTVRASQLDVSLKGNIQKHNNDYSTTLSGSYKIDNNNDRINIFVKLRNKTREARLDYFVKSHVRFTENTQYNSVSNFTIINSDEERTTALNIQYGNNPRDENRLIQMIASFKNKVDTKLDTTVKAKIPEKDIDIFINARHTKSPKILDSEIKFQLTPFLGPDRAIKANAQLTKHNDKMIARANVNLDSDSSESISTRAQNDKYLIAMDLATCKEGITKTSIDVKTPMKKLKQFKMEYMKSKNAYPNSNHREMTLLLNTDDINLIDLTAQSDIDTDEVTMKTTAQGKVVYLIVERMGSLPIFPKFDTDMSGNKIKELILDLKLNRYDKTQSIQGKMTADYGPTLLEPSITMSKTGNSLDDVDINVMLSNGREALEGIVVLKLVDNIKVEALLKSTIGASQETKHGIEFSHSQSTDKSEIKGNLYLHELHDFESSFNLLVSSIQHVELNAISRSSYRGFELNKLVYTHEGQDNRASCSVVMEDIGGVIASVEVVGQSSPVKGFSVNVHTPIKGFTKLIVSGSYDKSQVNAKVKLNDYKPFVLTGRHNDFQNPKLTLTTPMRQLQKLVVNVDGQLSDASVDFIMNFNDDDMMAGNIAVKYNNPRQMGVKAEMSSRLDGTKNKLKMDVEYKEKPRHVSHLMVSMNDQDKIKYAFSESSESDDPKNRLDIQLLYPSLKLSSKGVNLTLRGNEKLTTGSLIVLDKTGKILDADIRVRQDNDEKVVLTVRQPKYMKYRITHENNRNSQDNKISYNWDENDPDANVEVRALAKDDSDSYKTDRRISLSFTCPLRSVGVEHSIFASDIKIKSSGKVFWNKDDESQLSYDLQVKDDSRRRNKAYGADLEFKFPTRAIGMTGSASDNNKKQELQAVLSWDLDRDTTKKIGVKSTLIKGDHQEYDTSLILPKNAHVDTKFVMNKGNTIVHGHTQVVYSDDPMKTLTFFTKVENQPGSHSFFYRTEAKQNYSIQFGLSHPESRIDVKMASHLGLDEDRLTTSVGLDYLTSRRQMKNMDLFLEINKVKREINFLTNNPYRNVVVTGAVKSRDPLEMTLSTSVNGQEQMATSLKVNPEEKSISIDWNIENKRLNYQASSPAKTSLQFVRNVYENGQHEQDFKVIINLHSPRVLESNIYWKPGMLLAIRDTIFKRMKERTASLKDLTEEVAPDIEREVTDKYRDIVESIVKDVQDIVESVYDEIILIENDIKLVERKLRQDFDICDIQIGEYSVKDDISAIKTKIANQLEKLTATARRQSDSYKDHLRSLSNRLEDVRNRRPHDFYTQAKMEISYYENRIFKTNTVSFLRFLNEISTENLNQLWELVDREFVQKHWDPNSLIDSIHEDIQSSMNVTISSLIKKILQTNSHAVSNLVSLIGNATDSILNHHISTTLIDAWDQSHADCEIYQILKWAASYLKLRETIPRRIQDVLPWIHEIIEEEIRKYLETATTFLRNPITKYDPEQGVLQARVRLLTPIHRLDEIPSFIQSAILDQHNNGRQQREIQRSQWHNIRHVRGRRNIS